MNKIERKILENLLRNKFGIALTAIIMTLTTGFVMGLICYVIVDNITGSVTLTGLGGTAIGYGKMFFGLFVGFIPTLGLVLFSGGKTQ